MSTEHIITRVGEEDLDELLPLLRGYCDFYEVSPSDEALLAVSRALIADPEREGVQLIARTPDGQAVGFATIYWTWQTLNAARLAVMNDLFITHRGPRQRARRPPDRRLPRAGRRARRGRARVADGQGQPPRAGGLRPRRRQPLGVVRLLPGRAAGLGWRV